MRSGISDSPDMLTGPDGGPRPRPGPAPRQRSAGQVRSGISDSPDMLTGPLVGHQVSRDGHLVMGPGPFS